MRKHHWQVEFRARAQSDGLERLGKMVHFVIGHAVVPEALDDEPEHGKSTRRDADEQGREVTA
jgi:hypothetical protein